MEKTDSEHALTLPELLTELETRGIIAERKSIYDDLETLRSVGLKIQTRKAKTFQYYLESRTFSWEELRLLAETIGAAPNLSAERKACFLEKLQVLCSVYQGEALRQTPILEERREGPGEKIVLEFSSQAVDAVREQFGSGVSPEPVGKNRLRAVVRAETSAALFSWLFSQGTEVRLVSPKKLAEQFRERAKSIAKFYKN